MPEERGTAIVTGASGFVGSHLVEHLATLGIKVRALLRPSSSDRWLPKSQLVEPHRISDHSSLERAVQGVDMIFHLAAVTSAPSDDMYFRVNRDATRSLVATALKESPNAVFVLCSSLAAAGPASAGRPITEKDPSRPITPYGKSKLEAEAVVLESALHSVVVRPPTVYGPRDRDVLEIFRWAARGVVPIVGSHDQRLSMVHVDDLVRALVRAASARSGGIYFVTDGRVHMRSELVRLIAAAVGKKSLNVPLPIGAAMAMSHLWRAAAGLVGAKPLLTPGRIRDFAESDWTSDDSLARSELGYKHEVEIEAGIARTVAWYREHGWL
jgi:nucleoside-diphosphate-sugar epimerase